MDKRLKPGEGHWFIHRFPKKLRLRMKVAATKHERTLESVVREACEKWLKENKG